MALKGEKFMDSLWQPRKITKFSTMYSQINIDTYI